MSKKSRKRKEMQSSDRPYDALSKKKQTMRKPYLEYLGCAIMFFIMAAVTFILGLMTEDVAHSKQIIFGATPGILVFTMFFVFQCVRRFIIFTKLNKIESLSEDNVQITCKNVTFINQPVGRSSEVVICIVLTDENGKKYFDVVNGIYNLDKKETRTKLINEKITVNCYKNTNCVKSLSKAYKYDKGKYYPPRF